MKLQALALAFLAATAIGGIAWVFLYPLLSGERKAEQRRSTVAKSEPVVRQAERSQRSRREQVESSLKDLEAKAQKQSKVPLNLRISQAGLDWTAEILDHLRGPRPRGVRGRLLCRRWSARRARARLCRRLRPTALDPRLPEEAAREEIPGGAARRGRRHRPRHQSRPAAVRIDQGGCGRCARTAAQRISRDHRDPGHRHAARRSLRAAV